MDNVFLLHHVRESYDSEDVKLIGVFRSYAAAQQAQDAVKDKPGFRRFPRGFSIDEHGLDTMAWVDGFGFDDALVADPLQELARCIERDERVREVLELTDPDLLKPIGYLLALDTKPLAILAESMDDTVRVLADETLIPQGARRSTLRRGSAFSVVAGARLREGSLLVNSRGYADGLQLDFMLPRCDSIVTIQIVVAAATLEAKRVF
jgi:hypothetical protein